MFKVLTDSVPYPELLSGDMPEYDFTYKVVNKGYRPKFLFQVKNSLRKLIKQCWSENPSDRPAFDKIFNKLANKTGGDEEAKSKKTKTKKKQQQLSLAVMMYTIKKIEQQKCIWKYSHLHSSEFVTRFFFTSVFYSLQ